MDAGTITYEAYEDTLIIHMPKELDHHNCGHGSDAGGKLCQEDYL